MIYDHIVKFNGKYYNAGEEVPEKEELLPFDGTEGLSDEEELLPFDGTEGLSDEDIVLEVDSAVANKTSGRRGRPKKSEQ